MQAEASEHRLGIQAGIDFDLVVVLASFFSSAFSIHLKNA